MSIDRYTQLLASLRTGRVEGHSRPHKPVLMLAILSLADAGQLRENKIHYDPELFGLFRRYFDAVRADSDRVNMLDPFWRLRSDGLLIPRAKPGYENAVAALTSTPTIGQLRDMTDGSRLPDDLFELLQDPVARGQLREALIGRYFANHRDDVARVIQQETLIGDCEKRLQQGETLCVQDAPVREQAFRRVVLRAYDYRCAACGLRVVLDDVVLVDAAHLVPWNITQDDDPRNGIALCKNHHWAMDRNLIAPTPPPTQAWQVSSVLDDRIEGQRDLLGLRGRSIILPREERFQPREDALAWRASRLLR